MKLIRVFLVDDDEAVRDGIGVVLSTQPDIELVGEIDNRAEALHLVEELRPAVVLVDIRLTGDDGIDISKEISSKFSDSPSRNLLRARRWEQEAVSTGSAFLLKGCPIKELLSVLRS